MKHRPRLLGFILSGLILVALIIFLFTNRKEYRSDSGGIFSTSYHITYRANEPLSDSIIAVFGRINGSLSMFDSTSTISLINSNRSMATDLLLETVFAKSREVSEQSGGAFDITVAPLVNLWGFGFKHRQQVTDSAVAALLPFVGYQSVALDNHRITKTHPQTMLDLSAVAKGFACDEVARMLERNGVSNYLVEIGGEIAAKGINSKGMPWRVGINRPIDDETGTVSKIERTVAISQGGMATSGNYRNFYTVDGKKYAHTIDPKTGYPVAHSLLSATIIADDCMTADAYATACMVLGVEQSMALCEKVGSVSGFFIYSEGDELKTIFTPGFEKYLQ